MRRTSKTVMLLILFLLPAYFNLYISRSAGWSPSEINYRWVVSNLNITNIERHILYFSSLGSRFTGYPGSDQAAEYIKRVFDDLGLTVSEHPFNVVIPVDYGANITIMPDGPTFDAYPIWPNLVSPATINGSLTGRLVYVGGGTLGEISRACRRLGVRVEDSILLMDLNSGMRWLDAAKIGAKAVIFLGEADATRSMFKMKFLDSVPFSYPRLYVPKEYSDALVTVAEQGVTVEVRSEMRWERRGAVNIIGMVEGTEHPDKYVLFTAYYDSFSYVPSIAPGAQEAIGVSTLLELARFFSENPAIYTTVFVAFSGHNLGLVGSREFVQEYIFKRWETFGRKIQTVINLDIHTGSRVIAPTHLGGFYGGRHSVKFDALLTYITDVIIPETGRQLGKTFEYTKDGFSDFQYLKLFETPFPYDGEPFAASNVPAINLVTAYVSKSRWGTPYDLPKYLNMENLKIQLEMIISILYTIANTPDLIPKYYAVSEEWGIDESPWATISGIVAEYNYTQAWYNPVPHVIFMTRNSGGGHHKVSYLVSSGLWLYTFSNDEGEVSVIGATTVDYGGQIWQIQAFGVDPETGNVVYAPDLGLYKYADSTFPIIEGGGQPPLSNRHDFGYFTVFRAGSIIFFDAEEPSYLNIPVGLKSLVNNFETHSKPDSFGISGYFLSGQAYSVAAAFVEPGMRAEIILTAPHAARFPFGLLINASEEYPLGSGYSVRAGQQLVIFNTPLRYAESYYWLNNDRISGMIVSSGNLKSRHQTVGEMIRNSYALLNEGRYDAAFDIYTRAWHRAWQIYREMKRTNEDIVLTLPFFAALLIPFAFLAEMLFFESKGIKRIAFMLAIYLLITFIISFVHPGFRVAEDAFGILLGCGGLILTVPAIGVITTKVLSFVALVGRKVSGPKFSMVSKSTKAGLAFSFGIRSMKRRKIRTSLMLLAVFLMTAGLVGFTSLSVLSFLKANMLEVEPAYEGILLRHEKIKGASIAVGHKVLETIISDLGGIATIAPRMWKYPIQWPFRVEANGRVSYSPALSGITPQEINITDVEKAIVRGRWFGPGDVWACIIGTAMAESLGIKTLPATISLMGRNLAVIGIVNDEDIDMLRDLDGENPITPIDWGSPGMPSFRMWSLSGGIIFVPYDTLLMLGGGTISTIAIKFHNGTATTIMETAERLFTRYGLETYFSVGNSTYVYSKVTSYQVIGWQYQVVPMILVMMSLLNLAIASIYERAKEIHVLGSVGLSPIDVSIIFLAESVVYAVVGGLLGYTIMAGISTGLSGFFPGLSLNPSSSVVVMSIAAAMLTTISSTIYPMFKASRIVVPSLERKWKIPTKPIGDEWVIPLPFSIEVEEAGGILVFLEEYIESHRGEDMPFFTTEEAWRSQKKVDEKEIRSLNLRATLPPRETGIRQEAEISIVKDLKENKCWFEIKVRRLSGSYNSWKRANYDFIDAMRKRLLLWRSLSYEKRMEYSKKENEYALRD